MISQTVSLFWDDMGLAALWSGETALGVLDPMMGIDEADVCSRLAFVHPPGSFLLPPSSSKELPEGGQELRQATTSQGRRNTRVLPHCCVECQGKGGGRLTIGV